jgi:hypothetical protein
MEAALEPAELDGDPHIPTHKVSVVSCEEYI